VGLKLYGVEEYVMGVRGTWEIGCSDCGRMLAVEQATRHAVKRCAGTA